ncbi:MAG: amidohydrolase family protein [Candidatus Binatia bacterium]
MKLLIEHPLVVTVNDQNEVIHDGALVIEGRWIRYVGPANKAPPGPFDRVIDGRPMIAMPGLINAHCHSPANLHRGLLSGRPLEIWRAYWRATLGAMNAEDLYTSALLGAAEMLKTGTTTVLDHFFGSQALPFAGAGNAIRAMRELGLRHVVSLTLSDRRYEETVPLGDRRGSASKEIQRMTRSETQDARRWLETCESFISEYHDPDRLTICCPGPSAVQRCTDELLAGAADLARRRNLPMHIHLAETKSQKVMGPKLYGTSLLKHLDSMGALAPFVSLAHSIWIEPEDIDLFAKSGATPVHNPASNLRLGSGIAPVPQMLSSRVHVALGTDGAASNDGQNMFDAIRLATLLHNPTLHDYRMWVTPAQALRMATREGARAFGLANGVLAPGRLADVVLLRRDTLAFTPLNNVVNQIALCENGSSVDTVLVDGEIMVEKGYLTRKREEEIVELTRQSQERLRPGFQREMEATREVEPTLAEMYFRIASQDKHSTHKRS